MKKQTRSSGHKNENEYKESTKEKREMRGQIQKLTKEVKRLRKAHSISNNIIPEEDFTSLGEAEKQAATPDPNACVQCHSSDIFIMPHPTKKVSICKNCKHKWIEPLS